jgi:hypothetical protein
MKKYSLCIIIIPLTIIVTGLFLWLLKKETIRIEVQKQVAEEYLKKAENEKPNSLEHETSPAKEVPWDDVSMVNKYGGEVIQVGGDGSMMHQVTAFLVWEDVGYLKPAEDWVSVSFNSPADLMYVDCREGYKMYFCKVNGVDGIIDEHPFGCAAKLYELGNTPRNKVNIACIKE